ncbi:hypothetical protein RHGRI_027517 [Rhododendron griersonianum]|uniref:HAT C-terminal dimerisation domain-containing protein n=1 Tax=Rhododendron griersonianum TaxID=479676 RepID=A0AAV6J196_9ERIC|nr:hypothetical protein RHGRI_027517 [Rhododendron griersonianum]
MRCCAHILNLIVKDGLDVIKVGIEKIRDSVAYWTASQKREEKFEETVRQLNVTSTKKLGLDCVTRWNSTFLMLQTALLYKDVFIRLSKRDAQYNSLPSEREWGFARDVYICEIRLELRDWLHSENQVIREMAKRMVEKFDKYWSVVHGVVGVSAVLDPRDLLAIPVSTVASESAFSTSGRLVSPHRSRLHPDTMEALMCAQSWLWAAEMKGNELSILHFSTLVN